MQISELKQWPKLYKLCNDYSHGDITDYDYLSEAFTWHITEEGQEFWSSLNGHNIEKAKALQPHLFEEEPIVDSEGFTKCGGEEMPVPEDTVVDVKFRSGIARNCVEAGDFIWTHSSTSGDIVAYKLYTGDGYVNGVKSKDLGNSLKNVYKPLRYTDMVCTPENILKSQDTVLDFDEYVRGQEWFTDDTLNGFKADLRKKLNLLVVDNVIDGDIVEKFDKLMREM